MAWTEWSRQAAKAILFRGDLLGSIMPIASIQSHRLGSNSVGNAGQSGTNRKQSAGRKAAI
jgi:hypothetical protein